MIKVRRTKQQTSSSDEDVSGDASGTKSSTCEDQLSPGPDDVNEEESAMLDDDDDADDDDDDDDDDELIGDNRDSVLKPLTLELTPESQLDSTDPVCIELLDCTASVTQVLKWLTSASW